MIQTVEGTAGLGGTEKISELTRGGSLEETKPSDAVGGASFDQVLGNFVAEASAQHQTAASAADAVARGGLDDIHGTMLALSKADIELRYVGAVRNKIVDAFYELWRMQV